MAKRIKKGEPELLIVSFCDIVTVTVAAMFFAMLITIQEAIKVPIFKPTPRAKPTDKRPVFFECRRGEIFFVDKDGLDAKVATRLSTLSPGLRGGELAPFLKAIEGEEISNEAYVVDPKYLLVGIMAINARPDAKGENKEVVRLPHSQFQQSLKSVNSTNQYLVFLVRDDSFPVFRRARLVADKVDLESGWELLGVDEPIKFGQGGIAISPQ